MDAFDYNEELAVENVRNTSAIIWNVLTAIVVLMVLCVGGVFLVVFLNPNTSINPFPPPTLPAVAELPTSTPTPRNLLPSTWTPTITPSPTLTDTPVPTETPIADATEEASPPSEGTPGSEEGMSFVLQEPGSPVWIPNINHPESGCEWMGVAGQAFELNGAPMKFLAVQLGGVLGGSSLDLLTLTGTATQYGEGGYEFTIADGLIASNESVWVQLLDQAGLPLSDQLYFDTFADCEKNLVLINFQQVR